MAALTSPLTWELVTNDNSDAAPRRRMPWNQRRPSRRARGPCAAHGRARRRDHAEIDVETLDQRLEPERREADASLAWDIASPASAESLADAPAKDMPAVFGWMQTHAAWHAPPQAGYRAVVASRAFLVAFVHHVSWSSMSLADGRITSSMADMGWFPPLG
jgi:hypothetical protein